MHESGVCRGNGSGFEGSLRPPVLDTSLVEHVERTQDCAYMVKTRDPLCNQWITGKLNFGKRSRSAISKGPSPRCGFLALQAAVHEGVKNGTVGTVAPPVRGLRLVPLGTLIRPSSRGNGRPASQGIETCPKSAYTVQHPTWERSPRQSGD
jgi:hypothetical protein